MCPTCKSECISRSRKWHPFDIFMRLCGMKPWRCRECMRRFYLPTNLDEKLLREHEWLRQIDKTFDPQAKPNPVEKE